jgi:hypothetical protein
MWIKKLNAKRWYILSTSAQFETLYLGFLRIKLKRCLRFLILSHWYPFALFGPFHGSLLRISLFFYLFSVQFCFGIFQLLYSEHHWTHIGFGNAQQTVGGPKDLSFPTNSKWKTQKNTLSDSYLDILLHLEYNTRLTNTLYDKGDNINFAFVNIPLPFHLTGPYGEWYVSYHLLDCRSHISFDDG